MKNVSVPGHVGVIMDGNGRWATLRGLSRVDGHKAGATNVLKTAEGLFAKGVKIVSLYAFSSENFSRPSEEVNGIFLRIAEFADAFPSLCNGKIRLVFSGDLSVVDEGLRRACECAMELTKANAPFVLNILLNYGGRAEIIRAARMLCGEEITEDAFKAKLYTADLPDPDLIIRTGGERRLSGFMPFQSCYAELYFTDVLFPDFSLEDIDAAIEDYLGRHRRYGGL